MSLQTLLCVNKSQLISLHPTLHRGVVETPLCNRLHARQPGGDCMMDPAYLSAFAALAGSTIGGLTSLTASWLTHYVQFRAQQRAHDVSRREQLYATFIDEASRLYTEAYEHDEAEAAKLVTLYALVSKMRILSSPRIVESADRVWIGILNAILPPPRQGDAYRVFLPYPRTNFLLAH